MPHLEVPQFAGLLALMLGTAKLCAFLAQKIGQPSVLGELVAGVILGLSVAGLVDPKNEVLHVLAELGVAILLFEIGLETDLRKLIKVGGASATVALIGVVLPFGLGFGVCWMLGLNNLVGIVAGATLTATSVGITARVLSDLNRMQEPESQIILGAAVIDDVIGLVILAVVSGVAKGQEVTFLSVLQITGIAFGFLAGTLLVGWFVVPPLVRLLSKADLPGTPTVLAIIMAFVLAWLAWLVGSAPIIGAFAAGLLLRETPQAHDMEKGVAHLGHFFVPIFFVWVGSSVDVKVLNPFDPANGPTLLLGGLLIVAAVVGKFLAGYAPFWFKGKKHVIGIGMIPRGEVGLIFGQMGLTRNVFNLSQFSAITVMVMVTTFIAPPLLKWFFPPIPSDKPKKEPEGIEELVTEG
jgi:Kef-type K+ transport system membrane component KefB